MKINSSIYLPVYNSSIYNSSLCFSWCIICNSIPTNLFGSLNLERRAGTGRMKLSSPYFSLSQKASILTLKIVKKWLSLLLMFKSPSLELEAGSFRLFSLSERQIASFQHTFKFFIYWSSNADRTLRTWSKYLKSGINLLHKVLSKWRNFKTTFIII